MFVNGLGVKKGSRGSTIASSYYTSFFSAIFFAEIPHRRHQALHTTKSQSNICQGCKKTFSRLDALNVRLDHPDTHINDH
jgi:hypothetical protein